MNKIKLGSILEMTKGKKPLFQTKEYEDGLLPYVDIKAFETGTIDNYTDGQKCLPCEEGDILLVCDGSRSGLVGYAIKGYVGSTLAKLSANGVINSYLYYFLQSKYQILNTNQKGTGTPHVNPEVLKGFEINIPSISEQERIVARIEELFSQLDKSVETLQDVKKQLSVYRQAVLKDAFEGKLTEQHWKIDTDLKWLSDELINNLPVLPSEWRYINLSELGELSRGKSKHRPRNDAILFENGKYPFIQTGDVKAAKKYVETFSSMYGEVGLKQSKLWPKGTLCITIAANIAETAFLGIDACFPDSVVGFTANENVFPEYIRYFIEASKIRISAYAPATAQKNINLTTLENLVIPYCALDEQKMIVQQIEERLSICDNIEKTIDEALVKSEAMCQSILKQAFEGNL